MDNAILLLSKKLISLPTTSGDTVAKDKALKIAEAYLEEFSITHFEKDGVQSLLVSNREHVRSYKIIFNAHLDVVPGKKEQFIPVINNGKLYGRGTYDMKAAAATMIVVFKDVAKIVSYPLALQLVTDEEIGGHSGTLLQIEKGVQGQFNVFGENTNFALKEKAKGIMWVKITAKGKTAHGAYPWLGDNAVWKLFHVLEKLQRAFVNPTKDAWKTTINIASMQTENSVFNKVPSICTAFIDIRYIPDDEEKAQALLQSISSKDINIDITLREPAMVIDTENPYLKLLQKIIGKETGGLAPIVYGNGASDARFFTQRGMPATEFGPVGAGHHADSEWVDIKSLSVYYNILRQFLLSVDKLDL